jgi:SET domain-containing protein
MSTPQIEVREVPGKGRGVFALKRFEVGDIIEVAHVIPIPGEQWEHIEKTQLYHYCYGWGEGEKDAAVALGCGSLYNHSYRPNCVYIKKFSQGVIEYKCIRAIDANEEITINYNGAPDRLDPVWFELASEKDLPPKDNN